MADTLKLRGGSTSEHKNGQVGFTGADREVTVDTTKKTLCVHDGTTLGGTPLMREEGNSGSLASSVKFATSGADAISIDSSQRVGIGAGSPKRNIHIHENSTGTVGLMLTNTATGNSNDSQGFQLKVGTNKTANIEQREDANMDFLMSGNVAMSINTSRAVGIGTTNPTRRLEVHDSDATVLALNSTSAHGTALRIQHSGTDKMLLGLAGEFISGQANNVTDSAIRSSGALLFATGGTNQKMVLDSSGNCGIGDTNPSSILHIFQDEPELTIERLGDYSTTAGPLMQFKGRGSNATMYNLAKIDAVAKSGANNAGHLRFFTNNAGTQNVGMTITSAGNVLVGLGTDTELDTQAGSIQAAGPIIAKSYINAHTSNAAVLQYNANKALLRAYGDTSGSGIIQFNVGGGGDATDFAAMTLSSVGNCGIGTTSPTATDAAYNSAALHLHQVGNGTNGSQIHLTNHFTNANAENGVHLSMWHDRNFYITNQEAADANGNGGEFRFNTAAKSRCFVIKANGNLLVGTEQTSLTSEIFGHILFNDGTVEHSRDADGTDATFQAYGNEGRLRIMGDGDAENTNNSYGSISDETLKQDIVDAASQWNDIKNLKVRKFRFKDNPTGALQIGVVAQEIETVSAGLVKEDSEGIKSVKYSILYMKAVKCLQEAMTKIETLETKVAALEAA